MKTGLACSKQPKTYLKEVTFDLALISFFIGRALAYSVFMNMAADDFVLKIFLFSFFSPVNLPCCFVNRLKSYIDTLTTRGC